MKLEFWFDFGSTYSYPALMRLESLALENQLNIHWRPFLLGAIFNDQGLNDSPFNKIPDKGQYMWRDMERICEELEIPFQKPTVFPRNGLLAARIVSLYEYEAWVGDFIKLVFRENFECDSDISSIDIISECLSALGQDAKKTIDSANAQHSKDKLFEQTERAKQKKIFGAPTLMVGDEIFWGNDRLESAIQWAKKSK